MGMNKKIRKLLNEQLRDMTVGDIMETNVITINEDATLELLFSLISEYRHLGYPVVKRLSNNSKSLEKERRIVP